MHIRSIFNHLRFSCPNLNPPVRINPPRRHKWRFRQKVQNRISRVLAFVGKADNLPIRFYKILPGPFGSQKFRIEQNFVVRIFFLKIFRRPRRNRRFYYNDFIALQFLESGIERGQICGAFFSRRGRHGNKNNVRPVYVVVKIFCRVRIEQKKRLPSFESPQLLKISSNGRANHPNPDDCDFLRTHVFSF